MSTLELPLPFPSRAELPWRLGWRRVARVASWVVIAAIVAAWTVLLRPQFLGGPAAYVLVSGISMEPGLHSGDLVVVHGRGSYRVGDTVLYRVPEGETGAGSLIIHRIIGGSSASGWIVQGDNKDVPDLWRPKNGDIVGSLWVSVPGAGSFLAQGMSPFGLASISTLLALLLGLPAAAAGAVESRPRARDRPSDEVVALSDSLSRSWGEAAWTARDLYAATCTAPHLGSTHDIRTDRARRRLLARRVGMGRGRCSPSRGWARGRQGADAARARIG